MTDGGPYNVTATMDALLQRVREENALGALINPGFLKLLKEAERAKVRNALLDQLLGSGADVGFSLRALTTTWPTTRRPSTRKAMCMTGGLWCIHRCSMGGTY